MKNRIVAATVAALIFGGCTQSPPPAPVHTAAPVAPVALVIPDRSPKDAGAQIAEVVTAPPVEVKPNDGLGIEHSHRSRVDHIARATELKDTGDFEGALAEARRAVFDDAQDDEALRMITRIGKYTGSREQVAAAWGRLAELSPDAAMPVLQQARARLSLKDYEAAVKLARIASEKDPASAEAFHVIGRAYLAEGQLQDAIDNFHRAIEIDPDHGYALNNLGFAYLRSNQNEQAALVLEKAAEILPNVAYVQNNLGVAFERLHRTEEAKVAYQRSMDLSPKYVKARVNVDRIRRMASAAQLPDEAEPIEIDRGSDFGSDAVEIPAD